MWQFCYACHDATSQGADTNVQQGIYEGTLYGTQGDLLNGGGFEELGGVPVTSTHMYKGSSWGAYGGGYAGTGSTFAADYSDAGQGPNAFMNGTGNSIKMDCATCHDPHGSPNYRVLKTVVNGNPVGEYVPTAVPDDPDPNGFVSSVETGWPAGGFRLHTPYPAYQPDYTTARYAKGYDMVAAAGGTLSTDINKGMSGWCAGCHDNYLEPKATFTKASDGTTYTASATTYNAGDGNGLRLRHRHPINVQLDAYQKGGSALVTATALPLAHSLDESSTGGVNQMSDWIECLTCHRAHGTKATMTGWATKTSFDQSPNPWISSVSGDPNSESALLRMNNRGVCEACHNK
jgi:cytochrome c553